MKIPTPKASIPPARLGRYEVRAKIAEGGMATVFVGRRLSPAVDTSGAAAQASTPDHDLVALKVIRDEFSLNRDFVNMFLDEAKIVSRLRHPNIVQLYELGVEGTRIFLVMELLFGQSLWNVWDACKDRDVRLRYDMIAWIGARVAEGLHSAHDMRDPDSGQHLEIVHRDVNATNIFVTYDGQIKIIDFGLAKAVNRVSKTAAGIIKGKVAYMSPEQAIGSPVDRRTDIFALGTTLWEISVDRRLFKHADEIETLKKVHAADVPDPRKLVDGYPAELWRVLRRALARNKEDRYATAGELARDLDAFAQRAGREVTPEGIAEIMRELFGTERERQARWFADASAPNRPAPKETLKPPSGFYGAHQTLEALSLAPPLAPRGMTPLLRNDGERETFAPPPRPPADPAAASVTVRPPAALAPVPVRSAPPPPAAPEAREEETARAHKVVSRPPAAVGDSIAPGASRGRLLLIAIVVLLVAVGLGVLLAKLSGSPR